MEEKRIDIYVGFGTIGNTNLEKKEHFKNRLFNYCRDTKIDFSYVEQKGGYVLENGNYVSEDSCRITLLGKYNKNDIKEFADIVKEDYNQESLLVCVKNAEKEFI